MTNDKLTAYIAREMLDYDPETGIMRWKVSRPGGVRAGDVAGCWNGKRHITIQVLGRIYAAHRLAWLITHGSWPLEQIDHINGDGTDNRISNLRECTNAENQQNMKRAQANNRSGLLGVTASDGRWRARICVTGRIHELGMYSTPQEAHAAYLKAKAAIHPFSTLECEKQ